MRVAWIVLALVVLSAPLSAAQGEQSFDRATVKMWIPAVGQREDGTLFGVASSLEVTMHSPGTGQVFLSSRPLTQIDMQGSARLAVDTASAITGIDATHSDFLFKVETSSITIGGPSAGGAMAVAVAALLQGWNVTDDVVMTGMINPDGSIGPIGGVLQKLEAADTVGAERFLVPLGQSTVIVRVQEQDPSTGAIVEREETIDLKEVGEEEYGIEVEEVADLYDAVAPFTGFRLIRPEPTTDPLQGQRYGGITSRLAQNLTSQMAQRFTDVSARYENLQADGPDAAERQAMDEQLDLAASRLVSAREAQNGSKQYLASSLAFQGLVALDYVEALVAYYESDESIATYTQTYLSTTDAAIADVLQDIQVTYPIPSAQLDSQAGAEQRALEARELQASAVSAAQAGNFGAALQSSSFARERAESARWWWSIGVDVSSTAPEPTLSAQAVEDLWTKYLEAAELEVSYASLIVGDQPAFVLAQQAHGRSLVAAQEGLFAAAVLELIQALAHTNSALVALAGDEPVRQRLDTMAASAAYQIELAEAQGSPPVYAIALLELSNSRVQDDPVGAYAGYSTARLVAGASLQAAGVHAPRPGVEAVPPSSLLDLNDLFSPGVLGLALAMGIGAIFLLIAWGAASRRQDTATPSPPAREPTKMWIPFPDEPEESRVNDPSIAVPAASDSSDAASVTDNEPTPPETTPEPIPAPPERVPPAPASVRPEAAAPPPLVAPEEPTPTPKRRRPTTTKARPPPKPAAKPPARRRRPSEKE